MKTKVYSLIAGPYYTPDPKPKSLTILENEDEFWEIVKDLDYTNPNNSHEFLVQKLKMNFTKREIQILENTRFMFDNLLSKIYKYDTQNLPDSNSDLPTFGDQFNDFVNHIISMGKDIYYNALHDREFGKELYDNYEDTRSTEIFSYVFSGI